MLALIFAISAFACDNLIAKSDVDKMLAGIPHGKSFLKCDEAQCECIDGVIFEESKRDESGKIAIDPVKKAVRDAESAAKEARKAELAELKKKLNEGNATAKDQEEILKRLLDDK